MIQDDRRRLIGGMTRLATESGWCAVRSVESKDDDRSRHSERVNVVRSTLNALGGKVSLQTVLDVLQRSRLWKGNRQDRLVEFCIQYVDCSVVCVSPNCDTHRQYYYVLNGCLDVFVVASDLLRSARELLSLRQAPSGVGGRIPWTSRYPEIASILLRICGTHGTLAADETRASPVSRVRNMTLRALAKEVSHQLGERLPPSTLYTMIFPRRPKGLEERRHRPIVPLRFLRPRNSLMCNHPDGHLCNSVARDCFDLLSLYPRETCVVSVDNKNKIALGGSTAVPRGSSLLLSELGKATQLPDHDFPVANRHKITPSVYMTIDPGMTSS